MSLRFNDNLKRSFFLDTADLENERNQLLKPKNYKSYKQLKIKDNRNRKVSEKVLFRTRKIGIIVQKKQAFFF